MRQVLLNRLGGGQGIEHFFDQFTGPTTAWWKVLGSPELNAEVRRKLTLRSSFSGCTGAFTTIRAAWKHFGREVRPGGIIVSGSMCRTNPSDTWSHRPAFQSRSKTLADGGPSAQSRFDPIVTPLANGRNLRILAIVSRSPSYRDRRRAGIRPTATSTVAISNVRFTSTPAGRNAQIAAIRPTRGEPVTSTRRGSSEFESRIGHRRHRRPLILIRSTS